MSIRVRHQRAVQRASEQIREMLTDAAGGNILLSKDEQAAMAATDVGADVAAVLDDARAAKPKGYRMTVDDAAAAITDVVAGYADTWNEKGKAWLSYGESLGPTTTTSQQGQTVAAALLHHAWQAEMAEQRTEADGVDVPDLPGRFPAFEESDTFAALDDGKFAVDKYAAVQIMQNEAQRFTDWHDLETPLGYFFVTYWDNFGLSRQAAKRRAKAQVAGATLRVPDYQPDDDKKVNFTLSPPDLDTTVWYQLDRETGDVEVLDFAD